MKANIIIIFAIGLTALFSGCQVGPQFQAPEFDHPATYRFDTIQADTMANLAWWEMWEDTMLHRLIDTALVNNLDVRIAASRIEEARAFAGFTKADLYPKIDIAASLSRGNSFNTANLGVEMTNIGFAPLLNWEIDFWGKFRRSNRAAQQQLLANQYNQRAIMVDLVSEVATSYFLLLGF